MKLTHVLQSRQDWWDRNADRQTVTYGSSTLPPHGFTTRASYTVPNDHQALMGSAEVLLIRDGATAVPGFVNCSIVTTSAPIANIVTASVVTGTLGEQTVMAIGQGPLFQTGETIAIQTQDGSTGGTILVRINAILTEFDA